jgi:hypothetical protein
MHLAADPTARATFGVAIATFALALATIGLVVFAWITYRKDEAKAVEQRAETTKKRSEFEEALAIALDQQQAVSNAYRHGLALTTIQLVREWRKEAEVLERRLTLFNRAELPRYRGDWNDPEFDDIRQLLGGAEQLAGGVRYDAYDLGLVYQLSNRFLHRVWDALRPWVEELRRQESNDCYFEHFEWLVDQLDQLTFTAATRTAPGSLESQHDLPLEPGRGTG